jgi:hypothetical protein
VWNLVSYVKGRKQTGNRVSKILYGLKVVTGGWKEVLESFIICHQILSYERG